jgi:menaquinone-specific isochorismate synthase
MTILPLHPAENATPEALRSFLGQCQGLARRAGRPQLVSISLAVDALDPLAVLESIFEPTEPHFYAERPGAHTAVAGAEIAVAFQASGPSRFADVQRWIGETLDHTIAVGDVSAPFGGPHFFTAFAFEDRTEAGEPFPAASVFVPRWQVALAGDTTTAVANFVVPPDGALEPLIERVWRAHAKFRGFEYATPGPESAVAPSGSPAAVPSSAGARSESSARAAIRFQEIGDYPAAVASALGQIASGTLSKIVLARAQDVESERVLHPLQVLNGLRQRFPDCYAFSFTLGRGASFIGATPERLVRVSGGELETEALAGSARRGHGAAEDAAIAAGLQRSDKDRREHRQVLQDIATRLAGLGLEPHFSSEPQVRRLANVMHLHTAIRAAVPSVVSLLDILAAMHPTPAVGGQPRERAVPLIRQLEGFPRGLYAGALGWVNSAGGGEFFVGLRSALIQGARARVYAGAGIVAGSTPEKEFAETDLKFRAMLDAFGM